MKFRNQLPTTKRNTKNKNNDADHFVGLLRLTQPTIWNGLQDFASNNETGGQTKKRYETI